MKRTQIYLDDEENRILAQEAKRTGQNKSQLIRRAIVACYLGHVSKETASHVLARSAGAWKDAPDGVAFVDRLRPGRLAREVR